ncbi:hypothetical protein [Streptomyces sp. G1]|uniref:hypothetical protein n=1 Tax=Streptomyces sp. G1 TaxID=361572 RepID=UPI0020308C84|nr:hypothetical protein [Streptomyces sp. G1]MCM1972883.1 hypothetical protein [Streptomyces sp. G1]
MGTRESGGMMRDCEYRFEFQPGWFELTLTDRVETEALILAESIKKQFNPLELAVSERDLLRDLARRALHLNIDEPLLASAYYTASGNCLANFRLDAFVEDDDKPLPTPAETVPCILGWVDGDIAGEPDVKYLDLEFGSAVRVQAMVQKKRKLGFGRKLSEFIDYAVFPPGADHLVVVHVGWWSMAHTDELTALTDELVATMRRVPVDANGDEIKPNS